MDDIHKTKMGDYYRFLNDFFSRFPLYIASSADIQDIGADKGGAAAFYAV